MQTKPFFFLLLFCGCFFQNSNAQNTSTVSAHGNNEYPGPVNDAQHPCISEAEYTLIETRCNENRIAFGIPSIPQNKTAGGPTLLDWPLKAAADLHDCSYYVISAYVDQDINAGTIQDFNCGTNTYDSHRGTDISTWPFSFYKMDNDLVEVVAAAPGIILDKHDGEFDRNCTANSMTANYVVIQHADGSMILYWHMKNGSVTTTAIGQPILAGDYLGVVGSSGSSSGPHLHFEVWNGSSSAYRVDPYSGSCNLLNATSWWIAQKAHKETSIVRATVHTTDVVMPPCPTTETLNESNTFQIPFQGPGLAPGYAKFYIFIRDQVNGLVANLSILNPDLTTHLAWAYTSTIDSKTWTWGFSKLLPTVPGTYTFKAVYNGITCSSTFDITVPAGIDSPSNFSAAKIYPNPSDGNFTIEMEPGIGNTLEVYDLRGSLIFKSNLLNPNSEFSLPVQAGAFFYQVKNEDSLLAAGKLIVH